MKKILFILFVVILCTDRDINAQINSFCGSDRYEEILLQNSNYETQILIEERNYRYNAENPKIEERNNQVILPVVFHIIHNNGTENISDAKAIQGIDYLNQAFANEGLFQNDLGVQTDIQFCLAKRDEEGNEFSGILRYENLYTDMSIFEGFDYVKSMKLDSTRYINIQIVKNACLGSDCSIAGFAGDFRIVIESETLNGSFQEASVLIHEMGHYLGLKHTFQGGCANDDCLDEGDKVCDTPPDNRTLDGCGNPSNSCTTDGDDTSNNNPYRPVSLGGLGDQNDDYTNFMDYNFRPCREKFTQGQADRMHFFIENRYATLLTSNSCLPPCENEAIAAFDLPNFIAIGESLTIINLSQGVDGYQWYVDGEPESTAKDFNYTFTDQGIISIQLEAYNADTLCVSDVITRSINVYCPVVACFDYLINGQYLAWEDCSENAFDLNYVVLDVMGDTLHTSSLHQDSVYINNSDFVQFCITSSGAYCDDYYCEYISITSNGSEICGNEQDDDGDGLIDLFDPDCPCDEDAYQAHCPTPCEIIPDSFHDIKMKIKWESDFIGRSTSNIVTGDINGDNKIEIFSIRVEIIDLFNANYFATLIDGLTGEMISEKKYDLISGTPAIADINQDGLGEIIIPIHRETKIMDSNLNTILDSEPIDYTQYNSNSTTNFVSNATYQLNLADLNADGVTEILRMRHVINSQNGEILFEGEEGLGCNGGTSTYKCGYSNTIAANVIESNEVLEVIAGNTVYIPEFNNLNDSVGNYFQTIIAPSPINDGLSSVADINGDGKLDVIIVGGIDNVDGGGIWIWNPRDNELIASADAGERGGVAAIGDVDGDCQPEIAMTFRNELRIYRYVGTQNLELIFSLPTSDNSGFTGVTMFDFDQDGKQELIYRDETSLRLIQGETGIVVDSIQLFSSTSLESPVIADIDNDGQTEILIVGTMSGEEESRIYCFESASTPWAPARSVWNQYAYNPTQVNDDLTIPRYQQNAAQHLQGTEYCEQETCSAPYNNFMVQATYRTQEGCLVWPSKEEDFSITASASCIGDSVEVCLHPIGLDSIILSEGVLVSCWSDQQSSNNELLDQIIITEDTTCMKMFLPNDLASIIITINNDGVNFPPTYINSEIDECDYSNNQFQVDIEGPDYIISDEYFDCTPDSLIYYLIVDNLGDANSDSCISFKYYGLTNNNTEVIPMEISSLCFEQEEVTGNFIYYDTVRIAKPHLIGLSTIYWAINDVGFGPGIDGLEECGTFNNETSLEIDFSSGPTVDLGPDIIKCQSEVITLSVSDEYHSYLWSDLSTDNVFSTSLPGTYKVTVTDLCGRSLVDSMSITIDRSGEVQLIDTTICKGDILNITLEDVYDEIHWIPTAAVNCDTCTSIIINDAVSEIVVFARSQDCISRDTMRISYRDIDTTSITEMICSGDSIFFEGNYVSLPDIYMSTLTGVNECDSIVVLELEVIQVLTEDIQETICPGDSIEVAGLWYKEEDEYSIGLTSVNGCDSIVTLELSHFNTYITPVEINICQGDSIQIGESIFKEPGEYEVVLRTINDCDSLINLSLMIDTTIVSWTFDSICEGDSIFWSGNWQSEEGQYTDTLMAQNGCDSISILNLTAILTLHETTELEICEGDSLLVFGEYERQEDVYIDTLLSSLGCDSISRITLNVMPYQRDTVIVEICTNDSLLLNGEYVYDEGEYIDTFSGVLNCDKIVITNLGIVDILYDTLERTICFGDSLFFEEWIYEEGEFTYEYTSTGGCDSIVVLEVSYYEQKSLPMLEDILLGNAESILIDLELDVDLWEVQWMPSNIVDCDDCTVVNVYSDNSTEVAVNLIDENGCMFNLNFNLEIGSDNVIEIPNIFSPNGDGINDILEIDLEGATQVEFLVYDRWGSLVNLSNTAKISWDGTMRGQDLMIGVYVYSLSYLDSEGVLVHKVGDVTLVR